jgi:hypothetical protein
MTYSEAADKTEPGFAGLFTTKFADDRIGIDCSRLPKTLVTSGTV